MMMVFCGQCGSPLSPGDITCPRCGAKTDADLIENDPGTYNPTEISQAMPDRPRPAPAVPQRNRNSLPPIPTQPPEEGGPLVLGSGSLDEELANEVTFSTNPQMPAPPPVYANYPPPPQAGAGFQGSYTGAYPRYQTDQYAAVARLLASSHKGKTGALLLILFGLLLLTGAIIILLLTLKGIIFTR